VYESLPQPQNKEVLQLVAQQWRQVGVALTALNHVRIGTANFGDIKRGFKRIEIIQRFTAGITGTATTCCRKAAPATKSKTSVTTGLISCWWRSQPRSMGAPA
jgi:hypothetical protein